MEIEKLATSAVVTELSKTDYLSSFINSGDKEPCWDGHIYIHQDKSKSKKNIKKVATQIKGKAVHPRAVKRTISYPVSFDYLNSYMMNGGVFFFVVYLDQDSGEVLQIYYASLLPVRIKELIEVKKNKYAVRFRKFPAGKGEKTELLLNFYEDSRKQASFAGKNLPTIDELAEQGVLESLTISYARIGQHNDFKDLPKVLDGNSITIYANVKGATAPIPVEYHESIGHITMSRDKSAPVSVDGHTYYESYKTIITANFIEHYIGSSVRIIVPNTDEKSDSINFSLKICLRGTLNERITAIEFIIAMIEHGSFAIDGIEVPAKFQQETLNRMRTQDFSQVLRGYKRTKELLDSMNVKKDLDIEKCTEEDFRKLNLLIGTIGDKHPVEGTPETAAFVQKITIANLILAVVYLKRESGGYYIYDYFGNHFDVTWSLQDDLPPIRVSQFSTMTPDDYLTLDNLNLKTVVEDYKRIEPSAAHWNQGNTSMLYMLKAYDKCQAAELLDAAEQMNAWLQTRPDFLEENITTLNQLQIVARRRSLTFQEKTKLTSIATASTVILQKIGALLLLDEQGEAEVLLDTLEEDDLSQLKEFPIYKFYRESETIPVEMKDDEQENRRY